VAIDELPTLYLPTLAEWLPSADMDLIVGGGATSMIREELKQFLDQQGLSHQLTWAESLRPEMLKLVRREAEQDYDLITSVRWADVYGLGIKAVWGWVSITNCLPFRKRCSAIHELAHSLSFANSSDCG
jgi:hypothetical protein